MSAYEWFLVGLAGMLGSAAAACADSFQDLTPMGQAVALAVAAVCTWLMGALLWALVPS